MKNNRGLITVAAFAVALYVGNFSFVKAFDGSDVSSQNQFVEQTVSEDSIKANKDALSKAQTAMEQKDYRSAIVYLSAYINGKPKKYEPYKLRGECYYAMRQYELAEKDFQTAIDIKSADDKFLTGTKIVGAVVLGADKYEQKQNPELGNLYGLLMYSQKAQNKPYEASYSKAFEYNSHIFLPQVKKEEIAKLNCPQKYGTVLDPKGDEAVLYKVIENIKDGNYHEAAYKIPELQNAYPDFYLTYYLTGVVMDGLEDDENAIKAFEKAYSLNSDDFESLASLGQIYYSQAERSFSKDLAKKSSEYFEKAIKLNPNCYIYYYYKGLNELISDNYEAAIADFDSAIKLKTNDYNSMYYKLIAQYLNGSYKDVVDGATKLLYRHVSNYNSVMYLRASAYNKLGNNDAAMSDIETVFNNMNDIYNADIKKLSPKEQTLSAYLYYLKSQILKQNNQGAKSDTEKALENPIISLMNQKGPHDLLLAAPDFEAQYDYLRTAFSGCDFDIELKDDNYLITTKSVEKGNKLAENNEKVLPEDEEKRYDSIIAESPVAEHLASESLLNPVSASEQKSEIIQPQEADLQPEKEAVQEVAPAVAESTEIEISNHEASVTVKEEEVPKSAEQKPEILCEEKPAEQVINETPTEENVVQKPEVNESKVESQAPNSETPLWVSEIKPSDVAEESEGKVVENIQNVPEKSHKKEVKVNEKYANLDGVQPHKTKQKEVLDIKDGDDVVHLDLTRKDETFAQRIQNADTSISAPEIRATESSDENKQVKQDEPVVAQDSDVQKPQEILTELNQNTPEADVSDTTQKDVVTEPVTETKPAEEQKSGDAAADVVQPEAQDEEAKVGPGNEVVQQPKKTRKKSKLLKHKNNDQNVETLVEFLDQTPKKEKQKMFSKQKKEGKKTESNPEGNAIQSDESDASAIKLIQLDGSEVEVLDKKSKSQKHNK